MEMPPLDDSYFNWLYSQVGSVENENQNRSYWKLLKILFTKEFTWSIDRDENRAIDGMNLRLEFGRDTKANLLSEDGWLTQPCSMLEMLVALSFKLAFQDLESRPIEVWFWELIQNLGLVEYNDAVMTTQNTRRVKVILDRVINRRYSASGDGGLFPLDHTNDQDQRETELWYQAEAYLMERV
jgi:hypothetical protein